jgi:hypothetical protein
MLETMYVRCTHCGYDNSPEYRFCGMCGASLAHTPVPTTKPKEPPPRENGGNSDGNSETVHGPSFLGLAEDPRAEFHYLYEDEPPRSHAGLIFIVILLFALGGFGYWQWSHNGFPFNRLSTMRSSAQPSGSPSEVAPAQTQDQQTHSEKPMTGAGEVLPTEPGQKTQGSATGTVVDIPPQGGQVPASGSAGANTSPAAANPGTTPPEAASPKENTEEAKATPPEVPEKPAKTKAKTHAPAPKPAPATPAATAAPDADLEVAGERYLYGNGLPQNCTRAESNLRSAATHGNTKAQTVLGTMYATGHCVGRDLPTAYRWFARALHQEPNNSRISADLQVLWRQMTPQEKQLATASGP